MNNELNNLLDTLRTDVIHSMQEKGKYATGQTAQQITIVDEGDKASLQLRAYIQALEYGRTDKCKRRPGQPADD